MSELKQFPFFAKTSDPKIVQSYLDFEEKYQKYLDDALELMREATGNPELEDFIHFGFKLTGYSVTGVRYEDIADSHKHLWRKDSSSKFWTWRRKDHPLSEELKKLHSKPLNVPERPRLMHGENYMTPGAVFLLDDVLYSGFQAVTCEKTWNEENSLWSEISRQEWDLKFEEKIDKKKLSEDHATL